MTFHIEHVRPISSGGTSVLSNLALSCPGCNLSKSDRQTATDAAGIERAIFNPRNYEPWLLGWHLHFALDRPTGRILALTPTGEATIQLLKMNVHQRAFARQLQIAAGLIA